jgi:hypothetical protein
MSAENIFNNTVFQTFNDTAELSDINYVPIGLEFVNIILLTACICIIYFGIEISHPLYAVLFCNLVVALVSSFVNAVIFPFVKNIEYFKLFNTNSVTCLLFHCSSWCILSLLRYVYIIHKSWIDEKFPKPIPLLLLSLLGVIIFFAFGLSTIVMTVIHFGWPAVALRDMPSVSKTICLFTIFGVYFLSLGISCGFYIMILRKRGKMGHNSVHILDQRDIEGIELSSVNSDTSQNEERTSHTIQSQEINFSLPIEVDGLEQKRLLAEIQSAMRSLETNFVFTSILILTYVFGNFFSNPVSVNAFIFLKGYSPIITTILNFVKIQQLCQQILDNIIIYFTNWKQNVVLVFA